MLNPRLYIHRPKLAFLLLLTAALSVSCVAAPFDPPPSDAAPFDHQRLAAPGDPITGQVLDDYGYPLPNVFVRVKGHSTSTLTDKDGYFHIAAGPGEVLVFQHPSFDIAEAKIKMGHTVLVRLTDRYLHDPRSPHFAARSAGDMTRTTGDTIFIPAVTRPSIDVLYGETNPDYFLGSISTIGSNQLSTTPATSYTYALPGRLAGLDAVQTAGFYTPLTGGLTSVDIFVGNIPNNTSGAGPTDNTEFNITLRGHNGSFGNAPIAIVDGVQREWYSIDPESIESVSILKDALSNILLGQNSSRGTLLVTTKRPVTGPPRVSFTAETGLQTPINLPTPLPAYQYAYLLNEALLNDGKTPAYSSADFNAWLNHSDPIGHPDVNWYKTILRNNARISRYNLNVTGGGPTARYMIALNYLDQQGLFRSSSANSYNTNANLSRYTINSKVDLDVNKDFTIGLQVFGRLQDGTQPGATTATILQNLLTTPNNAYPVYNSDHSYGGNANYTQNLMAQTIGSGYQNDHLRDVMANLDLRYNLDRFLKGWWAKANGNVSVQGGTDINRSEQAPVFGETFSGGDTTLTRYGVTVNQQNTFTTTSWARYRFVQLSTGYDRTFGDHSLSAALLFDQKKTLLNYDIPSTLTNYAAKAAYNYKGRYLAEAAADYSGYDRYTPGHQYGLFWAGGLGWNLAKEKFLRSQSNWLDQLKLRVTYGLTGNANVDNYGYYIWREHFTSVAGTYPIGSNYPNSIGLAEQGTPGDQLLANVNATWERADKLDAGFDLAVLHNRILLSADYYHERYFDVMQEPGRSIALIGMLYPPENLGIDLYEGGEFSFTYQDHYRDFNYFITGNASVQQSKVLFMDEQYEKYSWNVHTGRPVGQRFGLIADGLFQTPADAAGAATITGYTPHVGDIKYKDLDHDGVIDQFDEAPIGSQKPILYYGATIGGSFKGFDASILIQGVSNSQEYVDNPYMDAGFQSLSNSYSQAYVQALGRWIPEQSYKATYPRLTAGGNGYNYSPLFSSSTFFLRNGDFWRVKNIDIGYNLPYAWMKRIKLRGIRFFANAQNFFTHAAYKGVDPEVAMPNYPMQKVINTGITVKL